MYATNGPLRNMLLLLKAKDLLRRGLEALDDLARSQSPRQRSAATRIASSTAVHAWTSWGWGGGGGRCKGRGGEAEVKVEVEQGAQEGSGGAEGHGGEDPAGTHEAGAGADRELARVWGEESFAPSSGNVSVALMVAMRGGGRTRSGARTIPLQPHSSSTPSAAPRLKQEGDDDGDDGADVVREPESAIGQHGLEMRGVVVPECRGIAIVSSSPYSGLLIGGEGGYTAVVVCPGAHPSWVHEIGGRWAGNGNGMREWDVRGLQRGT
ncbi:hypothetical protein B0H11DRAFT_1932546 [Mycena galericulata]|nr:hypothetical protein B0H11DRAFT_1932546 [Mycena galericulata]